MEKIYLKKFKLFILKKKYVNITNNILLLQNHIDNLFNNLFINTKTRNVILGKIFEISRTINTKYNNYCNNNLDNEEEVKIFDNLVKDFNEIDNEEIIFEMINKYNKFNLDKILKPLELSYQKIRTLVSKYGINDLKNILSFAFDNEYIISENILEFINEINNIVIPLSYNFFEVEREDEFYWRIPTKFDDTDYLGKTRELWIKNPLNKNYLKIKVIFKIDLLSTCIKTCQINYPYLYNKKTEIIRDIELNHYDIDIKFVKTFIRHNYLGNIYAFSISEYVQFIKESYFKYTELNDTIFINLIKEFVAKNITIKEVYNIIFLLLLGNNNLIDEASLLIQLIKEKKYQTENLYSYIYNNLTYYLQFKIKKSEKNINSELQKLKSLNTDDIDYKKQLVINNDIPDNVKALTMEKVEEMKSFNNEYYKQLTFVKTIINFPWPSKNDDIFYKNLKSDLKKSKDYLNNIDNKLKNSSYGHDETKKLLLQIIGKWISNPESHGTCFGLVGPPGVGKTLLAKSVSKSLNVPFAQITLGGQNDGELLHGHGYTYSGSQPGLIVKKMTDMGKSRCILYFDELDKTTSKHGSINEITSILIHLTDPNMNKTFQDRFFQGIDFPLDKVIIIFSYNDSNLIDPILLDRIKEFNVPPYTNKDKIQICKNFIIPEIEKSVGLESNTVMISNNLIEFMIDNYTNEAGVRSIKRLIEKIFLNLNLDRIYGKGLFSKKKKYIRLTRKSIINILDEPKTNDTIIHSKNEVGIINGLYATSNGEGGIIPIQVFNNFSSSVDGFEIKLTGNQGDVMKESVHCSLTTALQYIRNNLDKYSFIGNLDDYLKNNFKHGFHVHAPSTSVPKDGPSAGCAFTTAFISRILNRPIKNFVGMTGEIELTGKITKIGGLNYKLIGAKKAGVKQVYIPQENEKDLDGIKHKYPKLINDDFKVDICNNISDIIDLVLV